MGYNLPHHIEYNLQTNHFEVSDNIQDVTFISGSLAVVATASGLEAFPYNQSVNYGYITVQGGFDRVESSFDYIYAYSSTSGTIYRTTVSDLRTANGSPASLVEVYPLREDTNWSSTISEYVSFNTVGTNTITISAGECIITDSSPETDKAFVSYGRELKPPFSIKNRIKITGISFSGNSDVDSLLSISHSTTGINTSTTGSLRASFYIKAESSSIAKIGLYYNDGINDWYWDDSGSEWVTNSTSFGYNVHNTFYTVELVVTADCKITFNIYNSAETLLESISTEDDHGPPDFNLVSNGTFQGSLAGWTAKNGATLTRVIGGNPGNCLQITGNGSANPKATQNITLVAGRTYTLEFWGKQGSERTAQVYLEKDSEQIGLANCECTSSWAQKTSTFTPLIGGSWTLNLVQVAAAGAGTTLLFDEVTIIADAEETILATFTLWGWFGDNRSMVWEGSTSAFCTYKSDYFNVYPYWAAYEPVINDFDMVEIDTVNYLGVAVGDDKSGETGRAIIIENEHLLDEDFADCQVVDENSYDPRLIRFAGGDVYYQLGTGSTSHLYGVMDFWLDNSLVLVNNVRFNSETGLIFNSTLNDLAVYSGTSYDGLGDSIFTATDDGAAVIYQHRTNLFTRNYFSLGHENIIMHDSFIDYDVGYAPECWTSVINDSDDQSIKVLFDTGDYFYLARQNTVSADVVQFDKATLLPDRFIGPPNGGPNAIAVDDQFVWTSYKDNVGGSNKKAVVRHVKDSSDYDVVYITEWAGSSILETYGTMGIDLTHVYTSSHRAHGGTTGDYYYPTMAKVDKFTMDYEFFELTGSGIPSSVGAAQGDRHHVLGIAVDIDYVYILDWCNIGDWDEGPHLIRWNKSTKNVDKVLKNLGGGDVLSATGSLGSQTFLYLDDDYLYLSWGGISRIDKNMDSGDTVEHAAGTNTFIYDIVVGEDAVWGVPDSRGASPWQPYMFVTYKNAWTEAQSYRIKIPNYISGGSAIPNYKIVSKDENAIYPIRWKGSSGDLPNIVRVDHHFADMGIFGGPPPSFTDAVVYSDHAGDYMSIGDNTGWDFERTFGGAVKGKVLEMSDLSTSTNLTFKRHFKDIASSDNYVIKFKMKLKRYNSFYMALKYNGNTALEFRWSSLETIDKKVAPCSSTSWAGFSIASGTYTKSTWAEYKIEAFVSSNSFNFYIDDVKYESTLSGSFCKNVSSLNEIVFYTDSSTKQLAYLDGVTIYDYNEVAEDYNTEIDYPVFHGITNKSKSLVKTSSYNHGNPEVLVYNYDPVFGGAISQVNLDVSNSVCLYAYYSTSAPMGPEQVDINKIGVFNEGDTVNNTTGPDRIWACGDFGMNMFDKWDAVNHVESIHIHDISYNYEKTEVACGTKGGMDILSIINNDLLQKVYISLPHGCHTIYNSNRGIYFSTACSGVMFLATDDYAPYADGRELSTSAQKLFSTGLRNLSNNEVNCIHSMQDGENLLVSTESGVDYITYNVDTSYVPTEYAQYGFAVPQGSDKCFITPTGSCYYTVRGEGLAVSYAAPAASGTLYNDIEAQITTDGDQDLTIGRGVHIKSGGSIWNDYMKGQKIFIEHAGLIHKVEAYVKRVGNPDPLRCSIYSADSGTTLADEEQVYTEVSGIDTSYSWVEFNLPYYRVFASDPGEGDYERIWIMFTQEKMDWDNYYVIKTTTNITYIPFGLGSGAARGGQGNRYDLTITSGTWGTADNLSIEWSQIYTKLYVSDRWNTAGLWDSWDHIYTTSGTPALISSNINDIYVYEGASDYSTNQNWNKIYIATDSGVQIIDERRTDITLSKSTTIGLEGGSYDYNLMKGSTYKSTAVWNLEEEGNFYAGTNDGFEGGAFNAMNFTSPILLKDYLTTDEGYGLVPSLDLFSNNINDLEVIYLSGLRVVTI